MNEMEKTFLTIKESPENMKERLIILSYEKREDTKLVNGKNIVTTANRSNEKKEKNTLTLITKGLIFLIYIKKKFLKNNREKNQQPNRRIGKRY